RVKLELLRARERTPRIELAREQRDEIEPLEAQLEAARRHLRRVVEIVDEPRLPSEVAFDRFDGLGDLVRLRRQRENVHPHGARVQRRAQLMAEPRQEVVPIAPLAHAASRIVAKYRVQLFDSPCKRHNVARGAGLSNTRDTCLYGAQVLFYAALQGGALLSKRDGRGALVVGQIHRGRMRSGS